MEKKLILAIETSCDPTSFLTEKGTASSTFSARDSGASETTKLVLAIESSCDETAMSLVKFSETKDSFEIEVLSNVVASQIDIHKKYGGVWPELASRAHLEAMIPVLEEALVPISDFNTGSRIRERSLDKLGMTNEIDAIAVTQGPGLIGSLLMGTETANILANIYKKPIIPVNHLEGHIYSAFCAVNNSSLRLPTVALAKEGATAKQSAILKDRHGSSNEPRIRERSLDKLGMTIQIPKTGIFPILALVVSGGHTSLILMRDHLKYEIVGQTIDDAAGEAFDKVAKLMGLGYPGGPLIERLAQKGADGTRTNAERYPLPIAMLNSLDFSFSGLKTAVLYLTKDVKSGKPLKYNKADLAASFQKTVVDTLILKTQKAIEKYQPKTVILSGGVSANEYLRNRFVQELNPNCHLERSREISPCASLSRDNISILIPPKSLSTDNAVGTAIAAALKNSSSDYVEADPNLKLG